MSIVLKDVGYVYSIGSSDEKTALHDINLDSKKELIGIVGHTGIRKIHLDPDVKRVRKTNTGDGLFSWKRIYPIKIL